MIQATEKISLKGCFMNYREIATVVNSHETTRELEAARAKYRGQMIPKPALAIMDAEMARVAASNMASNALKVGDTAPDFILPDAHGEPMRLHSPLNDGPVVVAFYRGGCRKSASWERRLSPSHHSCRIIRCPHRRRTNLRF
jgi:hypothetical protein